MNFSKKNHKPLKVNLKDVRKTTLITRLTTIIFFLFIGIADVSAQTNTLIDPSTPLNSDSTPPDRNWNLTFSDEFNTPLDITKWFAEDNIERREAWNMADNVYTENGELVLRTRENNGRIETGFAHTFDNTNGNPFFSQTRGYFEARIKASLEPGQWSAFWLFPPPGNIYNIDQTGRTGVEVDIMESPYKDGTINMAMHYDGYGADQQSRKAIYRLPGLDVSEYHVYGFLWENEKYTWIIDGEIVWEETDSEWISQIEMYPLLTTEVQNSWAGNPANATFPFYTHIDYIRIYEDAGPSGNPGLAPLNKLPNIIQNGSFEDGLTGWQEFGTATIIQTDVIDGNNALLTTNRTAMWQATRQQVTQQVLDSEASHFLFTAHIKPSQPNTTVYFTVTAVNDGVTKYLNTGYNAITTDSYKTSGMFAIERNGLESLTISARTDDTQDFIVDYFQLFPVLFDEESALSLNSYSSFSQSVSITPNPTTSIFTIDLKDETLEKVVIYNELGQQVKDLPASKAGATTNEVDISNLSNGTYFVKITSQSGKIATKKIIKN